MARGVGGLAQGLWQAGELDSSCCQSQASKVIARRGAVPALLLGDLVEPLGSRLVAAEGHLRADAPLPVDDGPVSRALRLLAIGCWVVGRYALLRASG
jgi:hypothetical protein